MYFEDFIDELYGKTEKSNGIKFELRWFLNLVKLTGKPNQFQSITNKVSHNLPRIINTVDPDIKCMPWIDFASDATHPDWIVITEKNVELDENNRISKVNLLAELENTMKNARENIERPEYSLDFAKLRPKNYYSEMPRRKKLQ